MANLDGCRHTVETVEIQLESGCEAHSWPVIFLAWRRFNCPCPRIYINSFQNTCRLIALTPALPLR